MLIKKSYFNVASGCVRTVLPANQKPGLKILVDSCGFKHFEFLVVQAHERYIILQEVMVCIYQKWTLYVI